VISCLATQYTQTLRLCQEKNRPDVWRGGFFHPSTGMPIVHQNHRLGDHVPFCHNPVEINPAGYSLFPVIGSIPCYRMSSSIQIIINQSLDLLPGNIVNGKAHTSRGWQVDGELSSRIEDRLLPLAFSCEICRNPFLRRKNRKPSKKT
jgi:hypothetical protein